MSNTPKGHEIVESTKTVPVMETRQVGTKQVPVWLYNGMECATKEVAEKNRRIGIAWDVWTGMKRYAADIEYPKNDTWYFISNEDELEEFKNRCGYHDSYSHVHIYAEPVIGDWACSDHHDGGDSRDEIYIFTWAYIRTKIMKMIEELDAPVVQEEKT